MIECNEQQLDDLQVVLSTPAGRRFMHRLIYEVCDIEGGTFHAKVHDGACQAQHQNVREGQRDVAIELLQTFKANAELALLWIDAKVEAAAQCKEEVVLSTNSTTKKRKR